MRATKDLILEGRASRPFMVPALDAEVIIRPLRASESEEVQEAETTGLKAGAQMPRSGMRGHLGRGGIARPVRRDDDTEGEPDTRPAMSIDLAGLVKGTHRANQLAMHYGLVDPAMSLAEVQKTDGLIVEQIGEEVRRISGIEATDAVRTFRGLPGGPDNPGDSDGGDTAGSNPG